MSNSNRVLGDSRPVPPALPSGDLVPPELRPLKRWIGWSYVLKDGLWTKQPISPSTKEWIGVVPVGTKGQDWAAHWTDFDGAVSGASRLHLDGVGFVFTKDDPYLGVDIDHCRDPQTGEIHDAVSDWVAEATRQTYSEASPSLTGVHAIGRAQLNAPGNKKPFPGFPEIAVEMYDSARFFTFTGIAINPGQLTIGDFQVQVEKIRAHVFGEDTTARPASAAGQPIMGYVRELMTDDALVARINKSKKWAVLFEESSGRPVAQEFVAKYFKGDDSSADLALCSVIARFTLSPAQVIRIWRRSALWREKGDRRPDYVQRTIAKAMLGNKHGTGMDEVRMRHVDWFWQGRLPFGALAILDGDPGLGKSMLTISLIVSTITGKPFLDGTLPSEIGSAVLLSGEDDPETTIKPRFRAAGLPPKLENRVRIFTNIKPSGELRSINNPDDLFEIEMAIGEIGAKLIVIDPMNSFIGGNTDSNNDLKIRRAIAPLSELSHRTGCVMVALRHLTKTPGGKAMYRGQGSIAYIGAARAGFLVAEHPDKSRKGEFVLAVTKMNLAAKAGSLIYEMKFTDVVDDAGLSRSVPYVSGLGACDFGADDLMSAESDEAIGGKLSAVMEFLRKALASGPVLSTKVGKDANVAGFTEITLRRAREALHVHTGQRGHRWYWMLPEAKKAFEAEDQVLWN